ncbi:MAG: hypothetical protein KF812_09220 [Fimbriimonadaceae bacterium]|nr:hypothetical protein [Fimbriimonadaceae bacterium]
MRFLYTALAVMSIAASVWAQDNPLTRPVDVLLEDADIHVATRALGEQTGLQFVIVPSPSGYTKITLSLRDMTAEQAVRYIAQAAGASATLDENGVFVIRPGSAVQPNTAPIDTNPTVDPVRRPRILERIHLNAGSGEYIQQILRGGNNLDQIRYSDFDDMFNFSNVVKDQAAPRSVTSNFEGLANHRVNGYDGRPVPVEQPTNNTNGILLPGESANQFGGGGGQQGGGGGIGGGGGGQQGGGGGGNLDTGLQPEDDNLVPQGIDRVIYDPATNSFLVFGTQDAINILRGRIEQLDIAPRQVIVKLEFITASRSFENALGIDWLYTRGTLFAGNRPGSFARNADPVFINYTTGNVATRLRTVLTEGNGRVVNAPIVRTLENQPATFVSNVSTYIFSVVSQNGPGGITTVFQPIQVNSTTAINVKPRVNGDGTITMYLTPQISEFGEIRRSPDGSEFPDILTQAIALVCTVKDGETIALAGLTRKQDRQSVSRIPILSDLPLIGRLFRGRTTSLNNQDLIIFVTPRIVGPAEAGIGGP